METKFSEPASLQTLPEELLQQIVEHLDNRGLSGFSIAAKWCYHLSSTVRWREVVLTDCLRVHSGEQYHERPEDAMDDHDDTPMLKKLIVLAT